MINSPLIYFGPSGKPGRCEASLANKINRQCSASSKTTRPFSDGQEHPCCGQHARQYDTIVERARKAGEQRKDERELIARVAALNLQSAELHYTITGKPTSQVIVDLSVLEYILNYLHGKIEKLERGSVK